MNRCIENAESPKRNDEFDWNWSKDALDKYVADNYKEQTPEDKYLQTEAVGGILLAEQHLGKPILEQHMKALHIGIGDVMNGSGIIAPIMSPDGLILMGDIGQEKLDQTQKTATQLALGKLGIWAVHQETLAKADPRWIGSFQKAGQLGQVVEQDIRTLPHEAFTVVTTEFTPESLTSCEEEYAEVVGRVCDSLKPGGSILHMAYMIGSNGYDVGAKEYPAFPVTPEIVADVVARNGLTIILNKSIAASHMARSEGDPHHYDGMGVLIAVKE